MLSNPNLVQEVEFAYLWNGDAVQKNLNSLFFFKINVFEKGFDCIQCKMGAKFYLQLVFKMHVVG